MQKKQTINIIFILEPEDIDIDKYNGFISVVINEQISNLNSPPTAIINLHITVLKNYLAKNGFTLGALGYTNY